LLYVLKNILQRGFPTLFSKYLQDQLGSIQEERNFKSPFLFISNKAPNWISTIRGDEQNQYFPAKIFFEEIIPNDFGEYKFIQSLIIPEVEINEITGEETPQFVNQKVDFYLPQAKLVIEIDGQQHKIEGIRIGDNQRNNFLESKGIKTVRISTTELRSNSYYAKIEKIIRYLGTPNNSKRLRFYKEAYHKINSSTLTPSDINAKIIPTAVIRFQILLIDLLLNNYLSFERDWKFNLILEEDEPLGNFEKFAIEDFFIWFEKLYYLKYKKAFSRPNVRVFKSYDKNAFDSSIDVINVDFSLFQRWTDTNKLYPDLLFVRTDYFGAEKNYGSLTNPVN